MAHKVTYAALTAVAVVSGIEAQMQLLADKFTPAAYPWIVAGAAILGLVVRAWRDWQARQGH